MAYQEREGSGTLFRRLEKTKATQPDWEGKLMLGGTVYRVVAWEKQGREGDTFLSLAAEEPRARRDEQPF